MKCRRKLVKRLPRKVCFTLDRSGCTGIIMHTEPENA
jgi:hypothetical protein